MCEKSSLFLSFRINLLLISCVYSRFSLAFMSARDACNASTKHSSFDASILEIEQKDLKNFLDKLCEAPDL